MSDPTAPRNDSIYAREELSPDGVWRVGYDYMDGERSPLIVSPKVTEVATGRVVLDLWRSCVNGSVTHFRATGFQLNLSDPYGPSTLVATIDAAAGTFVVGGEAVAPRALDELLPAFQVLRDEARRAALAEFARNAPPPPPSFWTQLNQWMTADRKPLARPAPPSTPAPTSFASNIPPGLPLPARMKILLFASTGLFVLACCLPALEFKDSKGTTDVMLGLRALVVGWSGLFAGVMSWYANPFLALGLTLGFMRKPLFAAGAGVIAIAIALTVLSLVGRDLPADEGNVNRTTVVRLLPGCYVWISSMVLLPVSALFSRQP